MLILMALSGTPRDLASRRFASGIVRFSIVGAALTGAASSTWDADALLAIPAESRLGEAGLRTIQQSRSRFVRLT